MVKEITKREFEKAYPDVNTYGLDAHMPVYLDNGIVCIETEWNGERYELSDGTIVKPVYGENDETIGYEVE